MGLPLLLLLAAAVPTLAVSLYMDWLDRRQPEPRSALRGLPRGVLSVGPVLVAELLLAAVQPPMGPWGDVGWRAFVVAAVGGDRQGGVHRPDGLAHLRLR